jgi:hypothetical protein
MGMGNVISFILYVRVLSVIYWPRVRTYLISREIYTNKSPKAIVRGKCLFPNSSTIIVLPPLILFSYPPRILSPHFRPRHMFIPHASLADSHTCTCQLADLVPTLVGVIPACSMTSFTYSNGELIIQPIGVGHFWAEHGEVVPLSPSRLVLSPPWDMQEPLFPITPPWFLARAHIPDPTVRLDLLPELCMRGAECGLGLGG